VTSEQARLILAVVAVMQKHCAHRYKDSRIQMSHTCMNCFYFMRG
jgi:hypothetical protein